MKIRFSKYERVAGFFVLFVVTGSAVISLSVAIKQGWFEPKINYATIFDNGDGIHSGTVVQMAGLRAGAVDDVELQKDNKVKVKFYVLGKFQDKIKEDSRAILVRPFVIGERVLEVTVGSEDSKLLAEKNLVKSEETIDLMTLMSGKKLGNYMAQMSEMLSNLQYMMQAFLNKERTQSMVQMFDKLDPLIGNMNTMSLEVIKLSKQATDDENMKKVMRNAAVMTRELNQILPALNEQDPDLAAHLATLTKNLSVMTDDFKAMSTTMRDLGPELPASARRAIEALNEMTVLMKAMQKNYFLKGSVEEVRQEEAKDPARKPASTRLRDK